MEPSGQHRDTPLCIEGEMNIYQAVELKQKLLSAIVPGATLEADLSRVTEMDTAGLQLLMLAKNTARQHGGDLKLINHSRAVVDVFELLNLGTFFGDPLVIQPRADAASTSAR